MRTGLWYENGVYMYMCVCVCGCVCVFMCVCVRALANVFVLQVLLLVALLGHVSAVVQWHKSWAQQLLG